jgi:uncharacterized protein YwbE
MKKILLISGISAILLTCVLLGAFFAGPLMASASSDQNHAATPTSNNAVNANCELYLQTLASKLNVSVSSLEQDQVAARDAVINQDVKDGKLTQSQATAIEKRLASRQACSGKQKGLGIEGSILKQTLRQYQSSLLAQIAQGIHLTTAQLQAKIQQGQTLSKIAKVQKVSESQLHTLVINAVQTTLQQAQQSGKITKTQDTTILTYLKNHPALIEHWLHHRFLKTKR